MQLEFKTMNVTVEEISSMSATVISVDIMEISPYDWRQLIENFAVPDNIFQTLQSLGDGVATVIVTFILLKLLYQIHFVKKSLYLVLLSVLMYNRQIKCTMHFQSKSLSLRAISFPNVGSVNFLLRKEVMTNINASLKCSTISFYVIYFLSFYFEVFNNIGVLCHLLFVISILKTPILSTFLWFHQSEHSYVAMGKRNIDCSRNTSSASLGTTTVWKDQYSRACAELTSCQLSLQGRSPIAMSFLQKKSKSRHFIGPSFLDT
ncbi:hypothetical protein C0J52_03687 [Blattella germanica]|nr:hypothetical protein C0J52_03687 [Blattella germanica]